MCGSADPRAIDRGTAGGAVTVTVVVLVTVLVDGLGSTVVGGGGVLVSVIVTVSVCVSTAGEHHRR
ncbi:hypothetical protein AWC01_07035 [Mycobacterium doricum]|uniref:Uncharacterized protein n=1 Tax=Mycolicibacterium doricum TaxID=126673 RepID=A0A1X1TEF4_9MYCO|nr:hypothetical protein AWC01_07035 [Mycolicibacterium doricum]